MDVNFNEPNDTLIKKLNSLRITKIAVKELEETVETNKKEMAELEAECAILMDNASVTQVKVEGATMYRKTDKYASIDREKTEEAWAWLKANDMGYLIQATVNTRSLMAALKDMPEAELKTKPASIKISPVERVGMRGTK